LSANASVKDVSSIFYEKQAIRRRTEQWRAVLNSDLKYAHFSTTRHWDA